MPKSNKYEFYHDRKSFDPNVRVGDFVHLNLPRSSLAKHAKILMHQEGPTVITAMPSSHNATLNKLDREERANGQEFNVYLAICKKQQFPLDSEILI